jgi:hypothetical protein
MKKKVNFGPKPEKKILEDKIDAWVKGNPELPTPSIQPNITKKFTMLMPTELHSRIKVKCALSGITMVEAICELLEREFKS